MQSGQNPHDPLTQLNSHMGYGAMAGLNPFADMGVNPNDPNMVRSALRNRDTLIANTFPLSSRQ
jgi:ubiquilin